MPNITARNYSEYIDTRDLRDAVDQTERNQNQSITYFYTWIEYNAKIPTTYHMNIQYPIAALVFTALFQANVPCKNIKNILH